MHDFLSPRRQKPQPTRIFLANSFLNNISLDGTHRDTKYRALVELYEKDAPTLQDDASTSSETTLQKKDNMQGSTSTNDFLLSRQISTLSTKAGKHRSKGKAGIRRSNSLRSRQSRRSSSTSSSSSDSDSGSSDDELLDQDYPLHNFKGKRKNDTPRTGSKSSRNGLEVEEEFVGFGKPKKLSRRQRRSSSGSQPKTVKLFETVTRKERVSRTVSGNASSSAESSANRAANMQRSGSTSPGLVNGLNFSSSSPPIFEASDDPENGMVESLMNDPIEMTLAEVFAMPGEILDSHKGVITERKQIMFMGNSTSMWPVAQCSYISKYKLEQVDEEHVEKHDSAGRIVSILSLPPTLIQRITARLSRINSASSMTSSKSDRSVESPRRPTPTFRRPWPWPMKNRAQQAHSMQQMRPRRVSAASSIHIQTEAEALQNLLGIKLSSDPDDDLSYENLLVPLTWNVDQIGDLTREEAKNLLNTGEISVVSKLLGPAHPNSFDENYAFSKLGIRRELSEYRPRYNTMTSQESSRSSSHEPVPGEKPFANDGYRPGILEDPEWETAVHRQNIYLESYFSSIISNDMEPDKKKEALNDLFRSKFPHIQLTFSKFKSIKRDMRKACTENHVRLDLAVVALSYVYFEKLALKGFINKPNRKILASVCVVLAAKMNDLTKEEHETLFDSLQSALRVERAELKAFEFAVMVALGFDLHIPVRYVRYHYDLLTKKNEELPSVYSEKLQEPQPKQRLSISIRPIRQISWPGFSNFANHHRINPRPAARRKLCGLRLNCAEISDALPGTQGRV